MANKFLTDVLFQKLQSIPTEFFHNGVNYTLENTYNYPYSFENASVYYLGKDNTYLVIDFSYRLNSSRTAHEVKKIICAHFYESRETLHLLESIDFL